MRFLRRFFFFRRPALDAGSRAELTRDDVVCHKSFSWTPHQACPGLRSRIWGDDWKVCGAKSASCDGLVMRILFIYLMFVCAPCTANPIEEIEKKVNATRSWQSEFTQITNGKDVETGKLYIQKPGKMRFIYNNAPYTIYADEKYLIYYDTNIDQPTFMEIDQTPASLLLKKDLKFIDVGVIRHIDKTSDRINLELELPDGSVMILEFDRKTLLLNGWLLNDFQGNHIQVSLSNIRVNAPVDKGVFQFKRKRLTKG